MMIYDVVPYEVLFQLSKVDVPSGFPSNRKGLLSGSHPLCRFYTRAPFSTIKYVLQWCPVVLVMEF